MGNIYKNQTSLRIKADVDVDITSSQQNWIDYIKPSGATGHIENTTVATAAEGIFYYDVANATTLNESGWWKFWGDVIFDDGRRAPGEPFRVYIHEEGEV